MRVITVGNFLLEDDKVEGGGRRGGGKVIN
jgi:hypothetical protein